MELAHSITGDGHKLLNVPYDCGFFLCRDPDVAQRVFRNHNAAYLDTRGHYQDGIPPPLNIGIENSRRFRGLPVYATLMAYGRAGYVDILERQIRFARAVAGFIENHEMLDLLPEYLQGSQTAIQNVYIVVLFRANDAKLNQQLVQRINATSRMYVSGTIWKHEPACRIAVSNWQVEMHRDLAIVQEVLEGVLLSWQIQTSQ